MEVLRTGTPSWPPFPSLPPSHVPARCWGGHTEAALEEPLGRRQAECRLAAAASSGSAAQASESRHPQDVGTAGAWGCLSRGRGWEAALFLPPPLRILGASRNSILCGDLGITPSRHCPPTSLPHRPPTPRRDGPWPAGPDPRQPPPAALTSSGPSPGSPGGVRVFGVGVSHGGSHWGPFHPPGVEVHQQALPSLATA